MKIKVTVPARNVKLSSIPVGQVFDGRIGQYEGLFWKAHRDRVVVLSDWNGGQKNGASLRRPTIQRGVVRHYEPFDSTLNVKLSR